MKIYKYPIKIQGEDQLFNLPAHSRVLSVGVAFEEVFMWVLISDHDFNLDKKIKVYGTGQELPDDMSRYSFIGTVITHAGNYVWHIFEILW